MRDLRCATILTFAITVFASAMPTSRSRASEAKAASQPSLAGPGEQAATVEGQSLSISTSKSIYAPGEEITLIARIRNVGHTEIREWRDRYELLLSVYSIRVSPVEGGEVPMTAYGREQRDKEHERAMGSHASRKLKPNGEVSDEIVLTWYYDFSRAGKYLVSAKKKVVKADGSLSPAEATSNKLAVTVDESLRYRNRGDQEAHEPQGCAYLLRIPDFDKTLWHVENPADSPIKVYDEAAADLIRQSQNAKTNNARVYSIYLLGEFRAKAAVPALLRAADTVAARADNYKPGHPRWGRFPAREALAKIGSPAVEPVIDALADQASPARRKLMVGVLRDILGKDVAEFIVKKAADSATGRKKTNYEEARRELSATGG
jgi:hypothetical protein